MLQTPISLSSSVLAVNKIDLVGYSEHIFDRLVEEYRAFAADFGFETLQAIPLSARYGDNVLDRGDSLAWYGGPTLVQHLETVDVANDTRERPFRMPVQWVNRPNLDFRGFSGRIVGGTITPGTRVRVLPAGTISTVDRIVTMTATSTRPSPDSRSRSPCPTRSTRPGAT